MWWGGGGEGIRWRDPLDQYLDTLYVIDIEGKQLLTVKNQDEGTSNIFAPDSLISSL